MGDMGDVFRGMRDLSKSKRENNRERGAFLLEAAQIPFTSHNLGAHLVVQGPLGLYDYWPGTGKWTARGSNAYSRGVAKLIARIAREQEQGGG